MDNKLNQWLAVIDDMDRGKIEMAKAKNKIIKEAEVEIKYFTASEEAQYLADMRDLWESDRASELSYAREEGLKLGIEERFRTAVQNSGLEKRLRTTEEKSGEKKKQIEIAKRMLEKGKDIEEIIELTELTEEEIKNIKNDQKY